METTLILSPEQHEYAVRFAKVIINGRKQQEIQSDPLTPCFLHAPEAKTLTIGQAPTPGSEGFPTNAAGYQLTHFANTEQQPLHNISILLWEQAIQEQKTAGPCQTGVPSSRRPNPHLNKDMLVVKVRGREDLYPQSGDSYEIPIQG